jgi:DNA-binding XRE family transcriptional regulator
MSQMEKTELKRIRLYLNKTQNELGNSLSASAKSIQSYEQGWRHIPSNIERQLLLLLALKKVANSLPIPCWEIRDCPAERREKCIVWEYRVRHFCWLVNGTFCQGRFQRSWENKMKICRTCEIFFKMLPRF